MHNKRAASRMHKKLSIARLADSPSAAVQTVFFDRHRVIPGRTKSAFFCFSISLQPLLVSVKSSDWSGRWHGNVIEKWWFVWWLCGWLTVHRMSLPAVSQSLLISIMESTWSSQLTLIRCFIMLGPSTSNPLALCETKINLITRLQHAEKFINQISNRYTNFQRYKINYRWEILPSKEFPLSLTHPPNQQNIRLRRFGFNGLEDRTINKQARRDKSMERLNTLTAFYLLSVGWIEASTRRGCEIENHSAWIRRSFASQRELIWSQGWEDDSMQGCRRGERFSISN